VVSAVSENPVFPSIEEQPFIQEVHSHCHVERVFPNDQNLDNEFDHSNCREEVPVNPVLVYNSLVVCNDVIIEFDES
jgi:hypothetical protein